MNTDLNMKHCSLSYGEVCVLSGSDVKGFTDFGLQVRHCVSLNRSSKGRVAKKKHYIALLKSV